MLTGQLFAALEMFALAQVTYYKPSAQSLLGPPDFLDFQCLMFRSENLGDLGIFRVDMDIFSNFRFTKVHKLVVLLMYG